MKEKDKPDCKDCQRNSINGCTYIHACIAYSGFVQLYSTPQPEVKEGEKCNCLITRHFNNVLWDTEKPIEPEKPEHTYKEEVTATIKIDWK